MRGLENVVFDIRNTEYYQSEAHLVNQTYIIKKGVPDCQ